MNPNVKRHVNAPDVSNGWENYGLFYRRNYVSEDAYLKKQGGKLDNRLGWCQHQSDELNTCLTKRLRTLDITNPSMAVLCLGARLGGEVQAFLNLGCFAIGVDLNPGVDNQYVKYGDFHHLAIASSSTDIVYCNCFDHCLEPEKVLSEIRRVLNSDGVFMLEAKQGSGETDKRPAGSDHWDCLEWDTLDLLCQAVSNEGFKPFKTYHDKMSRAHPYGYVFRKASL